MDLREMKTKRSLFNAFLHLRTNKPLERISVKELCELAEISKATFYLHYRDIYDLSKTLQLNVIKDILSYLSSPGKLLEEPVTANNEILSGFYENSNIVNILFGDSQFSKLPECINNEIKNTIFREHPELKDDIHTNVSITYQIMGGFYVYHEYNRQFGHQNVSSEINKLLERLKDQ